ncbi:MAG: glycerol-3-phosphate 1-O-acyltransferase PlsY [Humidesulfovibrio sp.]|jgi:glycerol-3-phosphate acyltransferase PlsY|uniref:glycerol-3-phosphate 1-O-acyltransferase PlsY n=1 Tax=Humidesulfovibrio sp. TaxID=2910988 RepID=UPI0027357A14|nr:glycerol-3-phosphate 1-O-acyltransferase PlsY [Humidesulfovibrio sp.]MDP2847778.1 glycerol-3-phosphate 1-O-acyltransferase PlsY [Humidesulfovibrio sp.]
MIAFLLFLMAFGLGMVPFGLYVARFVKGIDPRDAGSRNVGATNVARLCGTPWGVLTLALDLFKGFLPCVLAPADTGWIALSLIGLAAIMGHAYSPLLNFRGGKAVATTVGVFLALAPGALILSAICCLLVIWLSGYVSVGSLTLALALPVFCLLTGNVSMIPLAAGVMLFLFWRHRENILRLNKGQEMPWRKGKKCEAGA